LIAAKVFGCGGIDVTYSLPRWRITRWLADAGAGVSDDVRVALIGELYGCWPIFVAGFINTILVAAVIAIRTPTAPFIGWFTLELVICVSRLSVLVAAHRAARARRRTPTDWHILLAITWSLSVGLGAGLCLASGDWISTTLACLSAAAMVGGTCFRNFSAPRLAGAMMLLSLGPVVPAVAVARQPVLYLLFLQMPLYVAAMTAAAFRLNQALVAVMHSKHESDYLARHDALTGLSNRAGLVGTLEAKLGARKGNERSLALLFLDLDHFKPVNDTFGHGMGDRLLKLIAEKLLLMLPEAELIARIGGDEFVVLADGVTAEQATAIGHDIIEIVTGPHTLDEEVRVSVGVSVGIAMSSEHGNEAEALLTVADAALYEAKSSGKSCCRMASTDSNLATLRRLSDAGTRFAPFAA
jgi:diguanylate cyclase